MTWTAPFLTCGNGDAMNRVICDNAQTTQPQHTTTAHNNSDVNSTPVWWAHRRGTGGLTLEGVNTAGHGHVVTTYTQPGGPLQFSGLLGRQSDKQGAQSHGHRKGQGAARASCASVQTAGGRHGHRGPLSNNVIAHPTNPHTHRHGARAPRCHLVRRDATARIRSTTDNHGTDHTASPRSFLSAHRARRPLQTRACEAERSRQAEADNTEPVSGVSCCMHHTQTHTHTHRFKCAG